MLYHYQIFIANRTHCRGLIGIGAFIFFLWGSIEAVAQSKPLQTDKTSQGKITVQAHIIDNETQKPMKGATLYMKHLADGSITGDISDSSGILTVYNAKSGRYYIAVSYLGYAKHKDTLIIKPSAQSSIQFQLGTIRLAPAFSKMNTVSVTAEREAMELSIDKKVFNVSKNIASVGGTATDALRQIPTVDVDVAGNISMRGSSNLVVQINGKQVGFTGSDQTSFIDQIPANMIEKIEIITNPSARYDAEGMAGIINIITKTNTAQSWNGTASVGAGTNQKYNGSVDIGYGDGGLNVRLGYNFRKNRLNVFNGSIEQEMFDTNNHQRLASFNQKIYNIFEIQGHFLKLNADYTIAEKSTLSANAQLRANTGSNAENILTESHDATPDQPSFTQRDNYTQRLWQGVEIGAGYKQIFSDKQHYFDISGRRSINFQSNDVRFIENDYVTQYLPKGTPERIANNRLAYNTTFTILQADYVQPHSVGKFESGLKATHRSVITDFFADSLMRPEEIYVPNERLINNFSFQELVLAAYSMYATKLENISIQAGVRAEHTDISTYQVVGDERNAMNYTNLFPSLHLSRKFDGGDEIQIGYSRRINRPQSGDMNPFTDYSNPKYLRKGNPNLRPELIDAVEASYMKHIEKHTLTATAYFRQTNNLITPIFSVDTNNITTMRLTNLNEAQNMGMEFIYRGQVFPWWTATANLNLFYNTLRGGIETGDISVGNVTYTIRFMSSFKMPWEGGNLQVNYNYNSPALLAQGERKAFHETTLGFRQDFGKECSLTFNVSDVLNTRELLTFVNTETIQRQTRNKPETRVATVNFTYRIGAMQLEQSQNTDRFIESP